MIYDGIFCVLSVGAPDRRHCCRLVRVSVTAVLGPTPGQPSLLRTTEVLCHGHSGEPGSPRQRHAQNLFTLWERATFR